MFEGTKRILSLAALLAAWPLLGDQASAQQVQGIGRPVPNEAASEQEGQTPRIQPGPPAPRPGQVDQIRRPETTTQPAITSKEALRPRPPVLEVEQGGGDFSEWTVQRVFHSPEKIRFRWSTTLGSYHHGQWQVSTLPFRSEESPGGTVQLGGPGGGRVVTKPPPGSPQSGTSLTEVKSYNPIVAEGGTGKAPAGQGKTALFTVNTPRFAPAKPPERPAKYYVRVVPMDAQNQVVGPASTQVVLHHTQPGEPTEFTPQGIWTGSEISQAKHDASYRVKNALLGIVAALEYLNPAYDNDRAAKDVRGGNYSIFEDEVLDPFPWDRNPKGLMDKAEAWLPRARRLATKGPMQLEGDFDAPPVDREALEAFRDVVAAAASASGYGDYYEGGEEAAKKLAGNGPSGEQLFGKGSGAPANWDATRERVLTRVHAIVQDAEKYITSRP